jgi:hypothetical protein
MKPTYYTSKYGYFVIPIDTIKYVDTDISQSKLTIYFFDGVPNTELYYIYPSISELKEEVKAIGELIQKVNGKELESLSESLPESLPETKTEESQTNSQEETIPSLEVN